MIKKRIKYKNKINRKQNVLILIFIKIKVCSLKNEKENFSLSRSLTFLYKCFTHTDDSCLKKEIL